MKPRTLPLAPAMTWPRSDPAELARFDLRSKVCTMNCAQHRDDPRTDAEALLQCTDCVPAPPVAVSLDVQLLRQALQALEYHREQTRPIQRTDDTIAALRERLHELQADPRGGDPIPLAQPRGISWIAQAVAATKAPR